MQEGLKEVNFKEEIGFWEEAMKNLEMDMLYKAIFFRLEYGED